MLISAFVSSELCFLLQVMKIFKYEVKKKCIISVA